MDAVLTPDNEVTRLMPLKGDSVLGLSAMFDQLVDDLQAFLLRHTNDAGGMICDEESLQLRTKRSTIKISILRANEPPRRQGQSAQVYGTRAAWHSLRPP